MAIQFKMVAKKNNLATPPEVKYYPCAVSDGTVDLEHIAEIVASRSTISVADCYGVLIAMSEAIGEELANGKIVKIDRLGSFALTLKGKGATTPDVLGKDTIKFAKIIFKPADNLKRFFKKISFKRIR